MIIKRIFVFSNGMVAVFDDKEQQVPELQGRKDLVLPKINEILKNQKEQVIWVM